MFKKYHGLLIAAAASPMALFLIEAAPRLTGGR